MKFFIPIALVAMTCLANASMVPTVSRPVHPAPAPALAPAPAPAPGSMPAPAPAPAAPHRPVSSTPQRCSCTMPSSIKDGYETDITPVFKAEAVETRNVADPHYSYTVMRVKVVFRGCTPAGQYIVVKSPKTAAACGVQYTPGTMYAVTAKLSRSATPPPGLPAAMEVYTATSCSYNKPWTSCPYDDKVFLYYSPVRGCSS